jgi:hypothetical protein
VVTFGAFVQMKFLGVPRAGAPAWSHDAGLRNGISSGNQSRLANNPILKD